MCPFVGAAVDADEILLCVAAGITDPLAPACRRMVREIADRLLDDDDAVATAAKAVVLALPGVAPEATPALDTLHGLVKDELMADGLLLGQFHDRCEVPAARNADFHIQASAVPLLVVRPLTLHDVLFLHNDPYRFGVFRTRYAELFDSGRVKDPLLMRAWAAGLSHSRAD
jgi:heptaprenyl diphosphate synthase